MIRKLMVTLSALVIAAAALTAVAFSVDKSVPAKNDGHGFGYHSSSVNINRSVSNAEKRSLNAVAEDLPSKYDARDEEWYKNYIKVKDQGEYGLCWAFSATTAAEMSYCKEMEGTAVNETSPGHLGYFFYNRTNDPLGNTKGDKNNATEGLCYDNGGTGSLTLQALANRTGLETESKAPYSVLPESYSSDLENSRYISLENAEFVQPEKGTCGDSEKLQSLIALIKKQISEHGAVSSGIYYDDEFLKSSTCAYFDDRTDDCNHQITIIGWDDDFSKDNFSSGHKPDSDGAWIVQNSWGDNIWGHDRGCIYVSYEDKSICSSKSDLSWYDFEPYDENNYLFQYDGTAVDNSAAFYEGQKGAEVFFVPKDMDMKLNAVGFTEWNEGRQSYVINVYTDLTDPAKPESGTKAASMTVSTKHSGYHKFYLKEAVNISQETAYSIVITFKKESFMGIEEREYYDGDSWITFDASIKAGQSFRNNGKSWRDLKASEICLRIKGYADNKKTPEYTAPEERSSCVGVKLKEISLPKGFSWQNPEKSVGNAIGRKEFAAVFTPDDTDQYRVIKNIPVAVNLYSHELAKTEAVAKTCTTDGNSEYWTCSKCGHYYSDEAGTIEIEKNGWILPAGHSFKHHRIAPKIGKTGSEYDKCTACGFVDNKKTLAALKPASTYITRLVKGKGSFTVKWKKKSYSGYQIQYSLKKSMASPKKKNIYKAGTLKTTIKKLKRGKRYYVRIRTFKKVSGKYYYSSWSKKKYVTTK